MSLLRIPLAVFFAIAIPFSLAAQETAPSGTLMGRVLDTKSGQALADVGVQIVGTTRGVQTGIDGRFRFMSVPAGTITIQVRRIGYQPKQITGLYLDAGKTIDQAITMDRADVRLEAVVATAEAERGTVSAALDDQRNATAIVSSIGSEQIGKSPDSDAAQALQRVSGVTVQDGKYLNVRGLDPRYTTASLNGSRLPSPEPERKVVPFDLFPANLLQSVVTSKTFTPDQQGDFSGGSVDLRTRESPFETQRTYSVSFGTNSDITGRKILSAPTTGGDWLGFGGGPRQLPGVVDGAGRLDRNFSQQEYNSFVNAFRNKWSAGQSTGRPATSVSISAGGTTPIASRPIGYVGAFTYSYGQEVRSEERRAFAVPTPTGGTDAVDAYVGSTGRESLLWGGLLNLNSLVGTRHRLSLNNTFTRSADNEARYEEGSDENIGYPFQITRLRYVQRAVVSSKLGGEHELTDRQRLEWGITGSRVTRAEPDRSEVAYATDVLGGTPFLFGSSESAVRTFGNLSEYNVNATADYTFRFGGGADHLVKFGMLERYTSRDSRVRSYSLQASLPRAERERSPEEIFGDHTGPADSVYRIDPLSQAGSYSASDIVTAGYAMAEYQLTPRLRTILGSRVEMQSLSILAEPAFGATEEVGPSYVDVLPSIALNFDVTQRQRLRLSASQTLARPEYREIVPIASRDVLGGEQFRGNINLRRTLVQNADVRWEFYPARGEVVSLAAFAKHFDQPIERVYRGTSGTRVTTFENAKSATNVGAELELRKGLGFAADILEPVIAFSNLTVMRSSIDIGAVGAAASVQEERAMVGQAPFVVNAGLTYADRENAFSATALYNVIGRRIFAASLLPLPNVYEEQRHVVDLSVRVPLRRGISAKLDAKNVLNSPYQVTQGTVEREFYRTGRALTIGLSWGN